MKTPLRLLSSMAIGLFSTTAWSATNEELMNWVDRYTEAIFILDDDERNQSRDSIERQAKALDCSGVDVGNVIIEVLAKRQKEGIVYAPFLLPKSLIELRPISYWIAFLENELPRYVKYEALAIVIERILWDFGDDPRTTFNDREAVRAALRRQYKDLAPTIPKDNSFDSRMELMKYAAIFGAIDAYNIASEGVARFLDGTHSNTDFYEKALSTLDMYSFFAEDEMDPGQARRNIAKELLKSALNNPLTPEEIRKSFNERFFSRK